jgi:hypothetical protein
MYQVFVYDIPLVISLAAVLAVATLVGITWSQCRARAARRWRVALDAAYVQQERAKRTDAMRNIHPRPHAQDPPKREGMPEAERRSSPRWRGLRFLRRTGKD